MDIRQKLFSLGDEDYKNFHARLVPNIDKNKIIGVRTPKLRSFSAELYGSECAEEFISSLPHEYYDENNLHAYIIEREKDFEKAVELCEKFLPYIDNWGTCDTYFPPVFKKNADRLYPYALKWLESDKTYTKRFAIGVFMKLFLDDNYKSEYPELIASVKSDEYYVKMMIAWYFATALAKQYDDVIKYFEDERLDTWINNKAIQKAVESRRISDDKKSLLRALKRHICVKH